MGGKYLPQTYVLICKICSSQPEEQISKRGAETEVSVTPCVKNRHISQSEIAEHDGDDSEPLVVRGKDKDHETQETIEFVCTSTNLHD